MVICRMAGYVLGQYNDNRYKQLSATKARRILLDNVMCSGSESYIGNCPHAGWEQHNCNHREDVGVHCKGNISNNIPSSVLF